MPKIAVAKNKYYKGFNGVHQNIPEAYEILELSDALERTYHTDAHLVAYIVPSATRQPRINKLGLREFLKLYPVEMEVFFADVDNPGHADWTDDMFTEAMERYDTFEILQTAGIYHTTHGARIIQPIDRRIPISEVEPYLRQWLDDLQDVGVDADEQCKDWTRHFRLPNVRRDGREYRSPYICLDRMTTIPPPSLSPLSELQLEAMVKPSRDKSKKNSSRPIVVEPVDWNNEVLQEWRKGVEVIARAVANVQTEWHTLFLAIAGALLSRQVPYEHVPSLCRAISIATHRDTRTDDRENGARTTVAHWLAKHPIMGYSQLVTYWPEVAIAVDQGANFARAAANPPQEIYQSLEQTTACLEKTITTAPLGVTPISASCGIGKTEAAIRESRKREKKMNKDGKITKRAPLGSKTAMSVPTHELAQQITKRFTELNTPAKHFFGPLSVLRDDGTPECRYHMVAELLVAGGQSIQREFCEGRGRKQCKHYDDCTARLGYSGPNDARVSVGPHALIGALNGEAGSTGLLIIDEPPSLFVHGVITIGDLEKTIDTLDAFELDYTNAIKPAINAIITWAKDKPKNCETILNVIENYDPKIIEDIRCYNFPDPRNTAPPLRRVEVTLAKNSIVKARALGKSSMILGVIYKAVTGHRTIVDVFNKSLQYTHTNQEFIGALRRMGAVIVMDANIKTHVKQYEKIINCLPVQEFLAPDGVVIERVHLYCSAASRKYWIPYGKLAPAPSLINAIRKVFKLVAVDSAAKKLGLITLKPIKLALDCILHPVDQVRLNAWEAAGGSIQVLAELHQKLEPIIHGWDGDIILGHYGAVRGLNTMADVDCLVTLGDPWPNLGQVRREIEYLREPHESDTTVEAEIDEMAVAQCRDELEQAHGRLRTIHRSRPGRAIHVGRVLPGGFGWKSAELRKMIESPASAKEVADLITKIGSVSAAARVAGCNRSYLRQCRDGKWKISEKVWTKLTRSLSDAG